LNANKEKSRSQKSERCWQMSIYISGFLTKYIISWHCILIIKGTHYRCTPARAYDRHEKRWG